MKTVGLKVLKNNLSKYVRAAAGGEVVRITDRDRVVAELRAPGEASVGSANPAFEEAVRLGLVRPALRRYVPPDKISGPSIPLEQILKDLDRDREDRF